MKYGYPLYCTHLCKDRQNTTGRHEQMYAMREEGQHMYYSASQIVERGDLERIALLQKIETRHTPKE